MKKYIEENNFSEIKITIVDSESKQKLDKIKEYISNYKEPLYIPDDLLKFLRSIIDGE